MMLIELRIMVITFLSLYVHLLKLLILTFVLCTFFYHPPPQPLVDFGYVASSALIGAADKGEHHGIVGAVKNTFKDAVK